jgi:hypothetical protein
MQQLHVFQSMWAMQLRSAQAPELTTSEAVRKIASAGFNGVSAHWTDRAAVRELHALLAEHGLAAEGQCFPKTTDDLKPVLDLATQYPVSHICLQADTRPRKIDECVPLLEGWMELGRQAGIPVLIETHRDRMTTDLYFTLDLMDRLPGLPLLADLSHFLVGREFSYPVSQENHQYMHRVMENSWAFHGRVASREQVQVELSFPQHAQWLNLFLQWWGYGFRSWRSRAPEDGVLVFVCELGPKPYAITDRNGEDTTDRWQEAVMLKECIRELWI